MIQLSSGLLIYALSIYRASARNIATSALCRHAAKCGQRSRVTVGKNLLFFLEGFSRSSGGEPQSRPGNCLSGARWVKGNSSCWEEKSIHEATRRGLRIEGRRLRIASVPRKATLDPRSSSGAFVDESSIHSH